MYFQVFAFNQYYPNGGMNDMIGSFHSNSLDWAVSHGKSIAFQRFGKIPDMVAIYMAWEGSYAPSKVWDSEDGFIKSKRVSDLLSNQIPVGLRTFPGGEEWELP